MNLWAGEAGVIAFQMREAEKSYKEIARHFGVSPEAVRSYFRRNPGGAKRLKTEKARREREERRWLRKGAVFPDPLLSALWLAHPEYRPPELVDRFLPAIYVPKIKAKRTAKPKPTPEAAKPIPRLSAPSRMEAIMHVVVQKYNIRKSHLISHRRNPKWAVPRQIAQYMAHEMTEATLPKIGRAFGGRDHTTILHAVRKMSDRYERDESFRAEIAELKHMARQIECQRPWDE